MPDMSQSSEPFDEEQICDDENPAKEIYDKVTGSILPQLYNCLMEKVDFCLWLLIVI